MLTSRVMAQPAVECRLIGMIPLADREAHDDVADFVERFRTFWSSPHTVPLSTLLTPDVRLVQPLTGTLLGLAAAQAWQQRLLAAMPTLRGEVESWSERCDILFIAVRLRASEPTYQLEWQSLDRFRLRGGLALERIAYFDSLVLLRQVVQQPRTWLRFLRWACREWKAHA